MIHNLSTLDIAIFSIYIVFIVILGVYLGKRKGGSKNTKSYFLANNSLPWWAVGSGLIAANISAEQLIGTTGSSYAMGIAIASWEWVAIPAILIAAKWTVPYFIKHNINTMPEYLQRRYGQGIRVLFAVFWVLVYVFINLTAVAYMGALSLQSIMGIPMFYGILGMMSVALLYSYIGGFASIAWTNFIQVAVLVIAGIITVTLSLQAVGDKLEATGLPDILHSMMRAIPEHFHLVLAEDNPNYQYIPGAPGLFGGMWIICLFGWCFNQFIVQNALAAKSVREAQKGLLFAAALKLFMPVILVAPGIAAFILTHDNAPLNPPDQAYPWLINTFIPIGFKGVVLAALAAAIISTLSALLNSAATLFVIDIYQCRIKPNADEQLCMKVAKLFMFAASLIVVTLAQALLEGFDQAYQFIQEFIGFIMPGMLCIFVFGIAWQRANALGASTALFLSVGLSLIIKLLWPELPHLNRTALVFLACVGNMLICAGFRQESGSPAIIIRPRDQEYRSTSGFNIGSLGLLLSLFVTYSVFW
ncbi:sodium:solute symporter family transporter [Pseudoteredinibacter isoporae]|uniref:SSS family solute:Na+ symporter n=1 Tax=Pseudoteredinibacter isoporae TaxID=570281 RepID=A0A7X0JUT2_9GAMM|nr:sodium/solute symporter [Pseudoteredinibacter isoporae]MBB6522562.1 SSS family solute:Na+ symporter [Pseudoteredinibacter isoporae]NHO88092.1 sodium/solute symporter [Pseudoteredinibacter isoporae]NIB23577.1 sodium/solute symporter [Pseudoteredinibacter isoporae]